MSREAWGIAGLHRNSPLPSAPSKRLSYCQTLEKDGREATDELHCRRGHRRFSRVITLRNDREQTSRLFARIDSNQFESNSVVLKQLAFSVYTATIVESDFHKVGHWSDL